MSIISNNSKKNKKPGEPLFNKLNYCRRCCMPESNAFQAFDEFGICNACRSSEQKMRIDWNAREKELSKIFEKAKQNLPLPLKMNHLFPEFTKI